MSGNHRLKSQPFPSFDLATYFSETQSLNWNNVQQAEFISWLFTSWFLLDNCRQIYIKCFIFLGNQHSRFKNCLKVLLLQLLVSYSNSTFPSSSLASSSISSSVSSAAPSFSLCIIKDSFSCSAPRASYSSQISEINRFLCETTFFWQEIINFCAEPVERPCFHSHFHQKVLTAAKWEVTSLDSHFEVNFDRKTRSQLPLFIPSWLRLDRKSTSRSTSRTIYLGPGLRHHPGHSHTDIKSILLHGFNSLELKIRI